jgi:hypothetical protein
MKRYKHGDKIRNWKYRYEWVPNQNRNIDNSWFTSRGNYEFTDEKVYYGLTYRYRYDPVPYVHRYKSWHGTKCENNGHGKGTPWKKAYIRDKLYQQEIRKRYSITFTMSDFILYKYGSPQQYTWKRSKKSAQWMRNGSRTVINNKFKGMKTAEIYTSHIL